MESLHRRWSLVLTGLLVVFIPSVWAGGSTNCFPAPQDMVAWWRAEGTANDAVGTNHATLKGGPRYAVGQVGAGFSFNGSSAYVEAGDTDLWAFGSADFSIEFWVNFSSPLPLGSLGRPSAIFVAQDEGPLNVNKWFFACGAGKLNFLINDPVVGARFLAQAAFEPVVNQWHHLAVVRGGNVFTIYRDGVVVGSEGATAFVPNVNAPLTIGQAEGLGFFAGSMDEVAIYRRALTPSEVKGIYAAGSMGKCGSPIAPSLLTQPQGGTFLVGASNVFSTIAAGSAPLTAQWQRQGTNIPGATGLALVFTNLQLSDAGIYSVNISNAGGIVSSSNIVVRVIAPGDCVSIQTPATAWWRAENDARDGSSTHHGTLRGGAEFALGKVSAGFLFNGVTSYVDVPDNEVWAFGTNDFSIEFWINFHNLRSNSSITEPAAVFIGHDEGSQNLRKWFFSLGGGRLSFLVNNPSDGPKFLAQSPFAPRLNEWYHLAMVRKDNTFMIYTNGLAAGTQFEAVDVPNVNAPLTLGQAEGKYFVDGIMDEIAIYRAALSASDIRSLHSVGSAGRCGPALAPSIFAQPQSRTVSTGAYVVFDVSAAGSGPLQYQWCFNGLDISGATNATLIVANAQISNAGRYSVRIGGADGEIISSDAVLIVNPGPACTPIPAGLVAWWRASDGAHDEIGFNHGTLRGNAAIESGQVGSSFLLSGDSGHIEIPDSDLWNFGTNDFTIEFWANVRSLRPSASLASPSVIFIASDDGPFNVNKWFFSLGASRLSFLVNPAGGTPNFLAQAPFVPQLGRWYHLAVVRKGARFAIYVDGTEIGSETFAGPLPNARAPLTIGQGEGISYLDGLIDEISIYWRALSGPELQAVFNSKTSGKCLGSAAPLILSAPQNRSVTLGSNMVFSVSAAGSPPLSYQWRFNGTNLPGATNSTLALNNVQTNQAGLYSVRVTNLGGSVISDDAVLSVALPPSLIRVVSTSAISGGTVSVPILLDANGTENAVSFSLSFNPQRLTYEKVDLASDATEAALLLNTSQATNGRIGIVVAFPNAATFPLGTHELVWIRFTSPTLFGSQLGTTPLNFITQPINTQVTGAQGQNLVGTFVGGTIALLAGDLEADVIPRPLGNREVIALDWSQVGLYAARLDFPTNASEFQRADCAPRSTLGDGKIKVTDWVQAGRYATALDPLAAAGGPSSEFLSMTNSNTLDPGISKTRRVRIGEAAALPQEQVVVPVIIEAQGDETAVGFTLLFDSAKLKYRSAAKGAAAGNSVLNINSNQVPAGILGVALALPSGASISAGSRELARLTFLLSDPSSGPANLAFGDQSVIRAISDANANELPADFVGGSSGILAPSLRIARANQSITLSWPLSAQVFNLQVSGDASLSPKSWQNSPLKPATNGNGIFVTVPLSRPLEFFRLNRP